MQGSVPDELELSELASPRCWYVRSAIPTDDAGERDSITMWYTSVDSAMLN